MGCSLLSPFYLNRFDGRANDAKRVKSSCEENECSQQPPHFRWSHFARALETDDGVVPTGVEILRFETEEVAGLAKRYLLRFF